MADQHSILPGTLDLLVLKAVSLGRLHGYGVLLRIEQITGKTLQIQQGALYPALAKLEHEGLISGEWGTSDNNRRARFYKLTVKGRKQLGLEVEMWQRLVHGIGLAIAATPSEV